MNYESIIVRYLREKHGRSAGRSYHMLTHADRDALVEKFGAGMVACIRQVANDPSWSWPNKAG